MLSGWRSEAQPQEVTDNASTLGDLLCVRAVALPHPDNKLSGPPYKARIMTVSYCEAALREVISFFRFVKSCPTWLLASIVM